MPPKFSSSPSSQAATMKSIMAFLKGSGLQPASRPGFAHALKLSYNTIDRDRLMISNDRHTLTYRYSLSALDLNNNMNATMVGVGFYTALMDELSTTACFAAALPGLPGVSLQMQTELLFASSPPIQEVDIVNTVTKLGKTVSCTRTDFVCATTQQPLAFSSHVKYMPTGSRVADQALQSPLCFQFYQDYILPRQGEPPLFPDKQLVSDVIGSQLQFHDNTTATTATFTATLDHTNPLGGMHGGCHAMVMEQVGTRYAQAKVLVDSGNSSGSLDKQQQPQQQQQVELQAMQIDFLAAAKPGSIDVVCETIGTIKQHHDDDKASALHVRVLLQKGPRILSEGKLRFAVTK